jgi:DNA-binding NarL/FixJ family response regulator
MQPAKVLIVDDHVLFRRGVRKAIEPEENFEVVGEAGDGREALAKARELKPDLILMDIKMPHCSGLEAVSAIKRELPRVKIIMLTVYDKDENLLEALKRGAGGFLSKNVRAKDLLDALREVMRGGTAIAEPRAEKILKKYTGPAEVEAEHIAGQLTPREREVLQKIGEGLNNTEIGLSLSISENTVKSHVRNILKKLPIQTRAQAVACVRRWGLCE